MEANAHHVASMTRLLTSAVQMLYAGTDLQIGWLPQMAASYILMQALHSRRPVRDLLVVAQSSLLGIGRPALRSVTLATQPALSSENPPLNAATTCSDHRLQQPPLVPCKVFFLVMLKHCLLAQPAVWPHAAHA